MEDKNLSNDGANFRVYETHKEFKEKYENDYYLNFIRTHPDLNFIDYLQGTLNSYLDKSLHVRELLEDFEKKTTNKIAHDSAQNYYNEISATIMFLSQEIAVITAKEKKLQETISASVEKHFTRDYDKINPNKLNFKGGLHGLGYLFTLLVEQGWLLPSRKNGKINKQGTAQMLLDFCEFVDRDEQPKVDDLRKALFESNMLSADKQQRFKIPLEKIISND